MPTIEELEAQVAEKDTALAEANGKLSTYQEKLGKVEDLESFTQLKADRDALKTKAQKATDLEKEIKDLKKSIKSNSDDDVKAELETKVKELEELTGKLTEAEAKAKKADELEAEIIKELMAELSDEHKEIAEGLSIPKLRAYVKLHGVKPPVKVDNGNAGGDIKLTDAQKKEMETMGISSEKEYMRIVEADKKRKEEAQKKK